METFGDEYPFVGHQGRYFYKCYARGEDQVSNEAHLFANLISSEIASVIHKHEHLCIGRRPGRVLHSIDERIAFPTGGSAIYRLGCTAVLEHLFHSKVSVLYTS